MKPIVNKLGAEGTAAAATALVFGGGFSVGMYNAKKDNSKKVGTQPNLTDTSAYNIKPNFTKV